MINWVDEIRSFQAVEDSVPDERIEKFAVLSCARAEAYLGGEVYGSLLAAQDTRLKFGVAALSIAALLKGSRMINEGSSIHDVNAFGTGEIRASEISEILRLAENWEQAGLDALKQLRNEAKAEARTLSWIDI